MLSPLISGCEESHAVMLSLFQHLILASLPLVEMLRLSYDHLGMKFAGKILAKAYERAEIKKDQKKLRKAFEFGMSL